MADNVEITAGVGTFAKTDQGATTGAHMQVVKLAHSGDGAETLIGADSDGLDVDVTRVGGVVNVQAYGGTLAVSAASLPLPTGAAAEHATAASPHAARLSDGSAFYDGAKTGQLPTALVSSRLDVNIGASPATVPVSDASGSLTVDAVATAPVAVRLSTGSAFIDTIPVSDASGSLSVDDGSGSLTVDGGVTAAQGTAAAVSSGWPVKITDGTDTVGISTVSATKALKVDVVQAVGSSAQTDKAGFTEGSGKFEVVGGVLNDTISSDPTEDQAAAVRITAKRSLHVNLRAAAGTEIGSSGAPIRTDPTGTTAQPVTDNGGSLTVDMAATTNAGATAKTADLDTGAGTDTVTLFGIAIPGSGGAVAGGTAAVPVRTDPTGTTTQPVSGTVTANQGTANSTPWNENLKQVNGTTVVEASAGVQKVGVVDEAGAAFSHSNPLPVSLVPQSEGAQWRAANTLGASETAVEIKTPTGGKVLMVCGLVLTVTTTGSSAVIKIFDNQNAAANMLYQGQPPVGVTSIQFATPQKLSAANNVLRYSTGTNVAADLTAYGYEA